MKAGNLKSDIRKIAGAPEVAIYIDGQTHWVRVQKSHLVEVLGDVYSSKADETDLVLDGNRLIIPFPSDNATSEQFEESDAVTSEEADDEDDLDDLLEGLL